MAALTNSILRHKRLVAVAWIVVAIVGMATAQRATESLSTSFSLPGQPAFETNTIILRQYHTGGRIPVLVPVITLPSALTVDSPGIRAKLRSAFERVAAAVPGSRVASYASTGNRMFVSHDGHTTFGLVFIPPGPLATFGLNPLAMSAVRREIAGVSIVGTRWHVTGMDALRVTNGGGEGPGLLAETLIGGTGALLVLVFVFGSVLAFVPLLMAAVAIPTSFLLVWGLASITSVNFIVQFLIALIGLGVAIDYSLLIVTRWREERAHGLDNDAAVQRAMETAGRAVIFSGTTVGISLLAMVALPVPFLRSMGYAGLLIPIVSVLVAITFLPVLLAAIGPRLDWPHLRQEGHASRAWTRWAQLMVRRRWIAAGVALVILALLMVPAVHIHLTDPKVDSLASTGDAHAGLVVLERAGIGPGALNPVEVLVPSSVDATHVAATLARLPGVRGAVAPRSGNWARSDSRMVDVVLAADTSSDEGQATLSRVRDAVKAPVRVGGPAAENQDFVSAVYGNFPLMALLITLLTTLLLMRVFRSVLLPLKAIVLNLLSLGAAMGAMVLIWQMGYGSKAIWGIESTGSITPWLPIMIFAFLFGLSMDYEVFILVRMREEYDATGSTRAAVVTGLGRTGRLVTCAALILFLAFMSLASGPDTEAKVGATGLAVGILLDATLIRALLVPALVSLFGRWNWWLPALPARLLRVQPSPARIEQATAPAPGAE